MILALIIAVFAMAAAQPTVERARAALVYAIPVVTYPLFGEHLNDVAYYFVAGILSALSAMAISRLKCHGKFKKNLIWLCFASISISVTGLISYHLSMEPKYYEYLLGILYIAAVFALTKGWGNARRVEGDNRDCLSDSGIDSNAYQSVQHSKSHR